MSHTWKDFSMGFMLFYVILVFEKINIHEYAGTTFYRAPYNHLIEKLNICNIPLSESEE